MSRPEIEPAIRLRGVRQNNLKNFDLDLPLRKLTVITGLSGSGKSSLAFDTLFAEGQRRYVETFSPYARQFFDRMDKPQADRIEGIPPAVAIEQKNSVRSTRSTIGTMTELCDYMKLVWTHLSSLVCRGCGAAVRKQPPAVVWSETLPRAGSDPMLITFELPLSDKLSLEESLSLVGKQGYQRLLIEGRTVRIEDAVASLGAATRCLTVVQDRLKLSPDIRSRFVEACEQAYHFGKGRLTVWTAPANPADPARNPVRFSSGFHCAQCEIDYQSPSPSLFSFNHPVGACPNCKGFGRIITISYDLALPDRSKTLAEGVVKPWLTATGAESQTDLLKACRKHHIPTKIPFNQLSQEHQAFVIDGEPGYGKDPEHQWPRAWYGVKGYFRWLESKSYKMHIRVLLSRYRAYTECPDCKGQRFRPESLQFRVRWPGREGLPALAAGASPDNAGREIHLSQFYRLSVEDALALVNGWLTASKRPARDPLQVVLGEVHARLGYLAEVGLGYLTLDRPTRTLSGGETERVNLTTCLGTRLVNTLFVLDEPSVGLHARDTDRLVRILHRLRDLGNTVVVVEHEASVMRAADRIVDLGPGQGERGGSIVFQGTYAEALKSKESLTGQHLSGRLTAALPRFRPVTPLGAGKAKASTQTRPVRGGETSWLRVEGATGHNLRDLDVCFPLERLVALTGVSGSGKTTLARDLLVPALQARLAAHASGRGEDEGDGEGADNEQDSPPGGEPGVFLKSISGWESLNRVVLVDQSAIARTPRSNPAVFTGAFDSIRSLFAETPMAESRGYDIGAFSFNSARGQCERCRGAGFERIEMQFLSDVFIRCPDCQGRRYREHILEVKLVPPAAAAARYPEPSAGALELRESLDARAGSLKPGRKGRPKPPATPVVEPAPGGRSGAPDPSLGWSIADMLESTVEDALAFLDRFGDHRHARRARRCLELLSEVGLGYLRLGQPINTLSGGESQRLKLVSFLAEPGTDAGDAGNAGPQAPAGDSGRTLFVFDEPTTGLHFEDVRVLLAAFQRLVDAGHSLLVIEHNLDVIRSADWVIDLGPEGGEHGGRVVAEGTPEAVMACSASHTGAALKTSTSGAAQP